MESQTTQRKEKEEMGKSNAIQNQSWKLGFRIKVDFSAWCWALKYLNLCVSYLGLPLCVSQCLIVSKGVKKILWDSKHLPFIAHRSLSLKFGPSPKILQSGVCHSTTVLQCNSVKIKVWCNTFPNVTPCLSHTITLRSCYEFISIPCLFTYIVLGGQQKIYSSY